MSSRKSLHLTASKTATILGCLHSRRTGIDTPSPVFSLQRDCTLDCPWIPWKGRRASPQSSKGKDKEEEKSFLEEPFPLAIRYIYMQRDRLHSQESNFLSIPNNSPSSCLLSTSPVCREWGDQREKGRKDKDDGARKDTLRRTSSVCFQMEGVMRA